MDFSWDPQAMNLLDNMAKPRYGFEASKECDFCKSNTNMNKQRGSSVSSTRHMRTIQQETSGIRMKESIKQKPDLSRDMPGLK